MLDFCVIKHMIIKVFYNNLNLKYNRLILSSYLEFKPDLVFQARY